MFDHSFITSDSERFSPNLGHTRRIIVDRLRASAVLADLQAVAVEVAKIEHQRNRLPVKKLTRVESLRSKIGGRARVPGLKSDARVDPRRQFLSGQH
jgi:hypothetical protein